MINIQKFNSVHIGSIWSILSTSVLFSPHYSNSVHFSPVCPPRSYYVQILFGPFCLIWSYSVHSVHSVRQSFIRSNSAHSVLFSLLRSNSVHSAHIDSIRSTLVLFCPLWLNSVHISSIRSTLVLFGLPQSYSGHSVHFGSIRSIFSTLVLFGLFSPLWSYSVHITSIRSTSVHYVHLGPT